MDLTSNGSAVMGCYNPTEGTSEVYEYKSNDPGPKNILEPAKIFEI